MKKFINVPSGSISRRKVRKLFKGVSFESLRESPMVKNPGKLDLSSLTLYLAEVIGVASEYKGLFYRYWGRQVVNSGRLGHWGIAPRISCRVE